MTNEYENRTSTEVPGSQEKRARDRFTSQLRQIRACHGVKQATWAEAASVDTTIISRLERGRQRPPERERLIAMGESWGLSPRELSNLCISAGYIPQLPAEFECNPSDIEVLGNALYEMICGGEVRGNIQILQSRLDQIRSQQP